MAGLVTSVNGAIVVTLSGRGAPRGVFGLWQAGSVIFIGSMLALGAQEVERAGELFRSEMWTQGWFALRLAGGVMMTVASVRWLWSSARLPDRERRTTTMAGA